MTFFIYAVGIIIGLCSLAIMFIDSLGPRVFGSLVLVGLAMYFGVFIPIVFWSFVFVGGCIAFALIQEYKEDGGEMPTSWTSGNPSNSKSDSNDPYAGWS